MGTNDQIVAADVAETISAAIENARAKGEPWKAYAEEYLGGIESGA